MIVTASNILEVENYIKGFSVASADTETYGLAFTDSLFSFIIACGDRAFYFNFKDYPEEGVYGMEPSAHIIGVCNRIFSAKTWFYHNAKFDLHKLRRHGIEVQGVLWDTKVNARILQNNLLDYSLEALTRHQTNKKSSAVDEYITEHKLFTKRAIPGKKKVEKDLHFDRVPFHIIQPYGESDALATLELGLSQMKAYESRPEQHALRDQENELLRVVFEMESYGIKIDPEFVLAAWKHEEGLIREAEGSFLAATGIPYKGIKKLQLVEILAAAGENISMSEKNNPVLDADALDGMKSPIAKLIQRIRFYEKRISSFYSTFMQLRDSGNIIHANLDQAGTETGRFSASSPNLQQLSKDDEEDQSEQEEYPVRGCFVPRDGRIFIQWDYKQQEYRLMLDYANERRLIERVNAGYDVHRATAELIGVTRNEAKTTNFAILYGSGPANLAVSLGITLTEAKKLIARYYAALPLVEDFVARVRGQGRAHGFIKNTFGRRWNIAQRDWNYILPNHLIQGSGADVLKKAVVETARFLNDRRANSKIVLLVHDSMIMEFLPEELHLAPEITRILETVYADRNGVKLTTDVEWSAKSLAKKDLTKGLPNERAA